MTRQLVGLSLSPNVTGGNANHYMQYWTFVVVSDIGPKSTKVSVEMKVTVTARTYITVLMS